MMPGGSTDYTDTDTMIVDWGDGTYTMVIGSGLKPLFVHTCNYLCCTLWMHNNKQIPQ